MVSPPAFDSNRRLRPPRLCKTLESPVLGLRPARYLLRQWLARPYVRVSGESSVSRLIPPQDVVRVFQNSVSRIIIGPRGQRIAFLGVIEILRTGFLPLHHAQTRRIIRNASGTNRHTSC